MSVQIIVVLFYLLLGCSSPPPPEITSSNELMQEYLQSHRDSLKMFADNLYHIRDELKDLDVSSAALSKEIRINNDPYTKDSKPNPEYNTIVVSIERLLEPEKIEKLPKGTYFGLFSGYPIGKILKLAETDDYATAYGEMVAANNSNADAYRSMHKKDIDLCLNLKYIVIVKEFSHTKPKMMAGNFFKSGSISGAAYVFEIWAKKYLGSLGASGMNTNSVNVNSWSEDSTSIDHDLKWNTKRKFFKTLSEKVTLIYDENNF